MKPISISAYARHRKSLGLPGGTLRAVQVAIRDGRLSRSITRKKKVRDLAAADAEWLANTKADYVPSTGPTSVPSSGAAATADAVPPSNGLADHRARKEAAAASIRELELAERQGALVSAKDVESHLANLFALCRTRLLSIPTRARQHDPSLSGPQIALIERLVRESLEDLASSPERDERRAG